MKRDEYKNMFENESTHFFYRYTHDVILDLLKKEGLTRKTKVLDVGCGTGLLVKKLAMLSEAEGVDSFDEAVKLGKKRVIKIKKGSIMELPYKNNSVDIVTNIDVLCHQSIQDDYKALKELNRVLKPGGALLIRVPAHQFLYSQHDSHVLTKKRYSYTEFKKTLITAGFEPKFYSFMNSFLFIPSFIKAATEKKDEGSHSIVSTIPTFLNELLYRIVSLERPFLKAHIPVPAGIELIALCKKPNH